MSSSDLEKIDGSPKKFITCDQLDELITKHGGDLYTKKESFNPSESHLEYVDRRLCAISLLCSALDKRTVRKTMSRIYCDLLKINMDYIEIVPYHNVDRHIVRTIIDANHGHLISSEFGSYCILNLISKRKLPFNLVMKCIEQDAFGTKYMPDALKNFLFTSKEFTFDHLEVFANKFNKDESVMLYCFIDENFHDCENLVKRMQAYPKYCVLGVKMLKNHDGTADRAAQFLKNLEFNMQIFVIIEMILEHAGDTRAKLIRLSMLKHSMNFSDELFSEVQRIIKACNQKRAIC